MRAHVGTGSGVVDTSPNYTETKRVHAQDCSAGGAWGSRDPQGFPSPALSRPASSSHIPPPPPAPVSRTFSLMGASLLKLPTYTCGGACV